VWTLTIALTGLALSACAPGPGDLTLQLAAEGFTDPLFVTAPPGDTSRIFVVEQTGRIYVVRDGEKVTPPFLDISDQIADTSGERGLLGLAFHPDYAENGQFFVNHTDGNNDTAISRFTVSSDPDVADAASEEVILSVPQPTPIHQGGMLAFGPNDGYLYCSLGDGGGANDPMNNAQDLGTLLGKILRIDVNSGEPYAIPEDNPFVGNPEARPEIWAYGLRNPWRFSFDRETADMWIADVGQSAREEINFQQASSTGGENYGWKIREGSICRPGQDNCTLQDRVDPIHDYNKLITQSITGGYVYRGDGIPGLQGQYFFADYVRGNVWTLQMTDGEPQIINRTGDLRPPGVLSFITSFGEDANGEIYLCSYGDGKIYRIVAAG
jgi:glucose/arabinose dehydrogenase